MRRATNRRQIVPELSGSIGVRGCGGKRCYDTFEAAQRVAKGARKRTETPLEAYHCRHCGKSHIGAPDAPRSTRGEPAGPTSQRDWQLHEGETDMAKATMPMKNKAPPFKKGGTKPAPAKKGGY